MFVRNSNGSISLLVIYVNDALCVFGSEEDKNVTIGLLEQRFRIEVRMDPTSFVGLELERAEGMIRIHQRRYIERMAEMFSLNNENHVTTPMEPCLKIEKSLTQNTDREFRRYIGALLRVSRFSRPDVAFAVNKSSQFQEYVTPEIKAYARRIIRYLFNTRYLAVKYRSAEEQVIRVFCDASYAPNITYSETGEQVGTDCYSISSLLVYHRGNLVNWSTKRRSIVTTSTTAAEIVAISGNIDAILIPREVLLKLYNERKAVLLYEDNTSTTKVCNGSQNKKMRHVLIKAAAVREAIEQGEICMENVDRDHQLADLLTKSVSSEKFLRLRNFLVE